VANLQVTNTYEGASTPSIVGGMSIHHFTSAGTNVRPIFLSTDFAGVENMQDIHALILGKAITGIPAFAN
jgi:hypothetical protein